jgi:glutamate carboxypeptidase
MWSNDPLELIMRILTLCLGFVSLVCAQSLPPQVVATIDDRAARYETLLEQLVNINSGTYNPAGVSNVADLLEPEFKALGFETHRISNEKAGRGPHLVATRNGSKGKRLLLIGHMDTVFEPSSPFQKFTRSGPQSIGPGVVDDKGGDVVMLMALEGLQRAGLLNDTRITVFLTGDEEAPAADQVTRPEFIAAGKNSDAALCFESGAVDTISTARRGATTWNIKVSGNTGHSSQVFTEAMGDGAAYELSRILTAFHDQLREPSLTYNVGMMVAGLEAKLDTDSGRVGGKTNIVPALAEAKGDVRAVSPEQLGKAKDKMYGIIKQNLQGTHAEITFTELYPPMPPSPGNRALMAMMNELNRELGFPQQTELDPGGRGAGDISFVAPFVDSLEGLGSVGGGAHAEGEHMDLSKQAMQAKRAAALIYRLTASK